MLKPARIALCLSISAVFATPAPGFAASATGYLNWSNKQAPAGQAVPSEEIHTSTGSYPVPPSPYGQVGDPFARSLRWPTKQAAPVAAPPVEVASQMPPPQSEAKAPHAVYQPMPQAPVRSRPMPQVSAPVEMRAPEPPRVVAVPVPQPEDPGLADDPDLTPEAPVALSARPEAAPHRAAAPVPSPATATTTTHAEQMAASRPLPVPAPVTAPVTAPVQAPVVATAPDPVSAAAPAYRDGAYQVPATSKYAARIAASRAAQDAEAAKAEQVAAITKPEAKPEKPVPGKPAPGKPAKGKPAAKPPETTKDQPTVPLPTPSLASEETDHVFIPGERATDASDEPRFYSLHRQYGMKPDPITVDHNATGALLGLNGLDAVEGGDPNNDHDSTDAPQPSSDPK